MISKEERNEAISRLKSIDENTEEYDVNLFKADFEIVLQYIEELETKLKKYELETIPKLQGELSAVKQVNEYDEQMIDTVKRKSSTIIQYN